MFIKLLSYTGENEPQLPVWLNINSISSIRPYSHGSSLTKVIFANQSILVVSKPEKIIKKINEHRYNKQ